MNVARAFTYIFEDENWVSKMLIGALVALASILILPIPILTGYLVAIVRRVAQGDETLPSWDDFARYWIDGLAIMVASLAYTLPFLILPFILLLPAVLAGATGSQELVDALGILGFSLSCILTVLWAMALLLVLPILTIDYAQRGDFGALFQAGRILGRVRACLGPVLMALIVGVLVGMVFSVVSLILGLIPCIGWLMNLAIAIYPLLVIGHVYGQIARRCPGGRYS